MYSKKDKRRIYWLIDEYLSNNITDTFFCDEFYYSYDIELDHNALSELEMKLFSELSIITSRFSPYPEDHNLDPNAFSTPNELREKIMYVKQQLSNFHQ